MGLTTKGVLTLLADWREAAERRNAQRAAGKVDLALSAAINELELQLTELPVTELRGLANAGQDMQEVVYNNFGKRGEVLYRGKGVTGQRIVLLRVFDEGATVSGVLLQGDEESINELWHKSPPAIKRGRGQP